MRAWGEVKDEEPAGVTVRHPTSQPGRSGRGLWTAEGLAQRRPGRGGAGKGGREARKRSPEPARHESLPNGKQVSAEVTARRRVLRHGNVAEDAAPAAPVKQRASALTVEEVYAHLCAREKRLQDQQTLFRAEVEGRDFVASPPSDLRAEAGDARRKLDNAVREVMRRDLPMAYRKKLPQRLWMAWHREIEPLQQALRRATAATAADAENGDESSKVKAEALRDALQGLIGDAEASIEAATAICVAADAGDDEAAVTAVLRVRQALALCRGDLLRYQQALRTDGEADWNAVEAAYFQAFQLLPEAGRPWHQLAIAAQLRKDLFSAIYRYLRAACASAPFPAASENLVAICLRCKAQRARLPAATQLQRFSLAEHGLRSVLHLLGGACCAVLTANEIESGSECVHTALAHLVGCVRLQPPASRRPAADDGTDFSAHVARTALVCICTATRVLEALTESGGDSGAWADDAAAGLSLRLCLSLVESLAGAGEGGGAPAGWERSVLCALTLLGDWLRCHSNIGEGARNTQRERFAKAMAALARFVSRAGADAAVGKEGRNGAKVDSGLLWEDFECQGLAPLAAAVGPRVEAAKATGGAATLVKLGMKAEEGEAARWKRLQSFAEFACGRGWMRRGASQGLYEPPLEAAQMGSEKKALNQQGAGILTLSKEGAAAVAAAAAAAAGASSGPAMEKRAQPQRAKGSKALPAAAAAKSAASKEPAVAAPATPGLIAEESAQVTPQAVITQPTPLATSPRANALAAAPPAGTGDAAALDYGAGGSSHFVWMQGGSGAIGGGGSSSVGGEDEAELLAGAEIDGDDGEADETGPGVFDSFEDRTEVTAMAVALAGLGFDFDFEGDSLSLPGFASSAPQTPFPEQEHEPPPSFLSSLMVDGGHQSAMDALMARQGLSAGVGGSALFSPLHGSPLRDVAHVPMPAMPLLQATDFPPFVPMQQQPALLPPLPPPGFATPLMPAAGPPPPLPPPGLALPASKPLIVVDAGNVAMRHGRGEVFSCRGIALAMSYFSALGHRVVAFLPDNVLQLGFSLPGAPPPDDVMLLRRLRDGGVLVGTPSQDYDDAYALQYAMRHGGLLLSNNDAFGLVMKDPSGRAIEQEAARRWIKSHVITFTFVGDELVPNPSFNFHDPG